MIKDDLSKKYHHIFGKSVSFWATLTTCDSDVIEKPSRRWRGAVQQLADVVWES